jgi:hypothetical protein
MATDEGQHVGQHLVVEAEQRGQPFREARHRQRREQHHGALRKVEHAAGLEDQHKTQCHQRIQHARHQAADQCFDEESHVAIPVQWLVPR